eukprot:TRINITY_DN7488_c0_g1_i1.p2 TRINITY_DN7488_c0_g1~~TRINITY_DN7488_c0_g1_i1.p2  ORF type:complete len:104 (-),score=8.40 TRINITY_DN7488_c0_g1_i1:97-408(-)
MLSCTLRDLQYRPSCSAKPWWAEGGSCSAQRSTPHAVLEWRSGPSANPTTQHSLLSGCNEVGAARFILTRRPFSAGLPCRDAELAKLRLLPTHRLCGYRYECV